MTNLLLEELDPKALFNPVSQSVGSEAICVEDWTVLPIAYDATNPSSRGVYRVAGWGKDGSKSIRWSLVLKVVKAPEDTEEKPGYWPGVYLPTAEDDVPPMYWKREPLAYASGLLNSLPSGLTAPRCFGIVERGPSVYWLWLEDIADVCSGSWTLARHTEAARRLGRFNGAYLTGRSLPDDKWLRSGWLRSWLGHLGQHGDMDTITAAAGKISGVHQSFGPALLNRLRRLWRQREVLLAALDRLPQVLCHRDVYPANLLWRRAPNGEEELVAVDWAFVGLSAVGEEIAPLIAVHPPAEMTSVGTEQLEEAVFNGYLQGLRDRGWEGDTRTVRLGYCASVALRYACLTAGVTLLHVLDPDLRAAMEARHGKQIEQIMEREAGLFSFALDRGDEARSLIGTH